MANQLLFKRVATLAVLLPDPSSFNATKQTGSILIENLRFQFRIDKTRTKDPNTAEILIFNLNQTTRAAIQAKALKILLQAGYEGQVSTIYTGDVRDVAHRHEGPDWITKIVAGDGERAVQHARINESFKGGVPTSEVIKRTAAALKIDPGNALKVANTIDGLGAQFVHGYSARGKAAKVLTDLLSPHGYEWSIQDGKLQILKANERISSSDSVELSSDSGLVGAPEFGAPETKKKNPVLKVRALLQPRLRPGMGVRIKSETISGDFLIDRVTHIGDNEGNDWYTDLEAVAL